MWVKGSYIEGAELIDSVFLCGPQGLFGQPFCLNTFVFGQNGAGDKQTKGHYSEGTALIEWVLDVVRRETEGCGCLQAFPTISFLGKPVQATTERKDIT